MSLLRCLFCGLLLSFFGVLKAQEKITGRIVDQSNGQALPGATILNLENGQGQSSNPEGYFEIAFSSEIQVSYLGYESQTLRFKKASQNLRIALVPQPFSLHEIQVSAYQSGESLQKTPGSISIIKSQDLQRDAELELAPVINRVPGVLMQSSNLNTNRLSIRGIGSRSLFGTSKIRAYWNEIPLTSGELSTDLEDIDLSTLGRIEIIKGPASSLYGAGLGGTVLMHSKKAPYRQTSLENQSLVGSYGLFRNVTRFETANDQFNLHLNYNQSQWDGYRDNNEYRRQSLNLMGEIYSQKNSSLQFIATWIQLKAFIPSSINLETFQNNPRAAAPNWAAAQGFEDYDKLLLGLSFSQDLSEAWSIKSSAFTNFRQNYEPRPFNILRENNQWAGLRSRLSYQKDWKGKELKFSLGGEFFREWYNWQTYEINERVRGEVLSDNREIRQYYNIFWQGQVRFSETWRLDAGLNFNSTRYELEDFFLGDNLDQSGNYRFENALSPRLALHYSLRPQTSFYLALSHGFSPPTVEETLTPEGQINPNIQAEKGWNLEWGSRGVLLNQRLSYDIALYWMWVKDLLVARRDAEDAFIGLNAGKTWHRGLELALNYQISPEKARFQSSSFLSYSWNNYSFRDFVDGEEDYSGNQLTGVPAQVLSAGWDWQSKQGFYGNLNFQWVDEMPIRDDNSIFSEAYALGNLKIGFKRFIFQHLSLDIYGGIQNIWDEKYASQILINAGSFGNAPPRYYYPGLERNFYSGLKIKWVF